LNLTRRGIYFAAKSAYSNGYAFKPSKGLTEDTPSRSERPNAQDGEREIFLTKLLVGNEVLMNRDESAERKACRALTVPPTDPKTGLKYNSVTGKTQNSQVWIVYENGRAYPEYLVRYYRGKRDHNRTPFQSEGDVKRMMKESLDNSFPCSEVPSQPMLPRQCNNTAKGLVQENQEKASKSFDLLSKKEKKESLKDQSGSFIMDATISKISKIERASASANFPNSSHQALDLEAGKTIVWEYEGNAGWEPYSVSNQIELEREFQNQSDSQNKVRNNKLQVTNGRWTYEIDLTEMIQKNISHSNRKQRLVRRRIDMSNFCLQHSLT
jgi:WWE domain